MWTNVWKVVTCVWKEDVRTRSDRTSVTVTMDSPYSKASALVVH